MRTPWVVLGALMVAAHARAQHCEPPVRPAESWIRATLRFEAAHFESNFDGWYEGVALGAIAHRGPFRARLSLPYYRLAAPTGVEYGFGDLDAKLEWAVLEREHWALGPGLSATFPTGDADARLGMGHVMPGGTIWATAHSGAFFGSIEAGYARALGDHASAGAHGSGHAHHGAAAEPSMPTDAIPSPMNREELTLAGSGSYELRSYLAPRLGLHAGFPLSDDGATRVTGTAGVDFPLGALRTAVGLELDFAGSTRRKLLVLRIDLAP